MSKKKCLIALFCLLPLCIIIPSTSSAQITVQITVSSQGSIIPAAINMADVPSDWRLTYGSGPQIIFLDSTVTHNGNPSIRLERHTSADVNAARECDTKEITVKPGDHIVAKCWIKTSASGLGDTNPSSGGRIGVDLYNHNGGDFLLYDIETPTYPNSGSDSQNYVHWGTSTWTQKTIDFIVPSTYFTYDQLGKQTISPMQITSITMWMQVWSSSYGASDPGQAWFADAQLYINP